jgi:hypothetical protein
MKKLLSRAVKKGRGRPPTNPTSIHLTLAPGPLAAVNDWIERQKEPCSRPEAIRRLVELGLTAKTKGRPKSEDAKQRKDTKQRARELAGAAVDEMTDRTASPEDRASRKRRLIKGPEEFENVRRDRPNKK